MPVYTFTSSTMPRLSGGTYTTIDDPLGANRNEA
jgi:hypothetical protein